MAIAMIQPGHCAVCDKPIAGKCPTCGSIKFNEEHNQVEVTWSNGSVMPIGVCRACASESKHLTPEGKKIVTEGHWAYWEKEGAKPDKEIIVV